MNRLQRARYGLLDVPDLLGSIVTADIADGAVTVPKLAPNIVPSIVTTTRALLSATDATALPDHTVGIVFGVTSAYSQWRLEKTSTATVDGFYVLAATAGRWIRVQLGIFDFQNQAVWCVDAVGGNNEADGLTQGTAIRDFEEWAARTQCITSSVFNVTMRLFGAFAKRFDYPIQQRATGSFAQFFLIGQQTVSRAGSCTAASTNPNQTTEFGTITDNPGPPVNWAADIGKLVVAANGSSAWVLADLGGGVARVSAWATAGGGTSPAPPGGTTYNVVTLTQLGVTAAPNHPLCTFYLQDVQVTTGIRSTSPLMGFLRCKFTSSQVAGAWMGLLANCLVQTGTWRLSNDQFNAAISAPCLYVATGAFLNTVVSYSHGYLELLDVAFQGSRLALTDKEANNVHSGGIGSATLTMTGTYGVGFFAAPAGQPLLDVDFRGTVYDNESLFGAGNLGDGVRLGHQSSFFVKATPPVVAVAGTQLVLPADPIPALVQGALVPPTAACATFAAVAAAPFNGEVWSTSQLCTVKIG